MKDLISVIVPMYNTEVYIEKTIQSIVNQTYQNLEIILINDASTDKTKEIAIKYADKYPWIKLVNQEFNKGVSAARNLGLKIAKGNYITFVDSDDLLTKQALEILYDTAKENDADLVLGLYKNFSKEGTRIGNIYKQFKSLTKKGRIFTFTNPEIFSHVYIVGKLYKKELIEEVSFPEGISYAEDQPFTIYSYLNAKRIFVAPSVVYYYREREVGESATQLAVKYPLKNLQSVFDSFQIGRKYVDGFLPDKDNYALLLYLSRVLEGSIRFIFEGAIMLNNQTVLNIFIEMLNGWIEKLDDFMILGTDSFQKVFFDNGELYMKYFNSENQRLYIQLLRLIRDKKNQGNIDYKYENKTKNYFIDLFLKEINPFLVSCNIVTENDYSVCYPTIHYYSKEQGKVTIHFYLVENMKTTLMKISMVKENDNWSFGELKINNQSQIRKTKISKKKPKILLTYREFSGCNTFALYKSIPPYITKEFEVDFVSGNRMSLDYVGKVLESDIIVTTNMEYGFDKFGFNPEKIVIDLWHGFPLKKMFYEDPYYRDKSSIAPYWKQFNYLSSYSNLYNEVVNKCINVDPNNFFITGAPRNDFLYVKDSRKKLFNLLDKEDKGQKMIVYMPTFRLSDQKKSIKDIYNIFGFEEFDFKQFTTFLEENNFELIIKAHPIFGQDFEKVLGENTCVSLIKSNDLMNSYVDFYEILGAADLLITDYSSVYFDYLLLDKPIIFTPTDLEEYQVERGFILDSYEQWTPGPKVITQLKLQNEILGFKNNTLKYKDFRNQIKNKVHYYKDSNSSERVWEFISSLNKRDN
ncbi:CDP-glycerol glycerophosphotransferase family protein [Bacillus sp. FJAT-49711]|uniref:bifunctional glycosyltransferase/CDP-glycerol:glycerophosphate glycerophosphotransferase n=1 Tax=Bacillus sp. FJAT-49711 TaxID=2833585 RepID=UPI001BC9374E|nr:CDP-glycerol glycerophosphotransferase family protein [Bacillus sp. FJAT-49711]MBS4219337.1 CDP-glycerol glycerophosphotransferase family protein [Bacillus sp. FJAT-49711]